MAGGKQTPRQKMVNLMYLVFIAMMALNMSKEVLSAFGLMNEKFEKSNADATGGNDALYRALADKAQENSAQYGEAKKVAEQVKKITADFYAVVGTQKDLITKEIEKKDGKLPYETMDKGEKIDEAWFAGDGYSAKGKAFLDALNNYKKDMVAAIGNNPKLKRFVPEIEGKFDTKDVKDHEGVTKKYLDYHYKGFPAIASLAKLSSLQNDVKSIEASIYTAALGEAALKAASMNNYKAIVLLDKSAFFSGEAVTGRVVLGRYDDSTVPNSVSVNGGSAQIDKGQAVFKLGAGAVGEHDITGNIVFKEEGKDIKIPVEGSYVVVPKPNSATISADKMNSVYRGVDNPMTISFAGVSDNNVTVSAPGLRKGAKAGQYVWNVTSLPGDDVTVTVTAKLPDNSSVSDKRKFIVRDIPAPTPQIRGKLNSAKGNTNDLSNSTIGVAFPGFVFDVDVTVKSFEISVPGSPRLLVQGNKFDGAALAAIKRAKRGDIISIGNIKVGVSGAGAYKVSDSGNFLWEVQ
ncbi:MAG: gliding motility protein GldM [Bacteroidia bacterium]